MGGAIRGIISRRHRAVDHISLGPLRPHTSRLNDDDLDVPFREELFVKGLAESFEGYKHVRREIFFDMRRPRHTELACVVESKRGAPIETTNRGDIKDTTGGDLVLAEVLHGLNNVISANATLDRHDKRPPHD